MIFFFNRTREWNIPITSYFVLDNWFHPNTRWCVCFWCIFARSWFYSKAFRRPTLNVSISGALLLWFVAIVCEKCGKPINMGLWSHKRNCLDVEAHSQRLLFTPKRAEKGNTHGVKSVAWKWFDEWKTRNRVNGSRLVLSWRTIQLITIVADSPCCRISGWFVGFRDP